MLLKEESALKCRVWNTEIANVVISQRDGTYQIWYLSVGFSPPPALCQSSLHHLHVRCNLSSSLRSKTPRGDFSSSHFEIWEKPVSRARQDRTEDRGQRGGLLAMWHSGTLQGWTTFLLEIPLSKSIHICSFPHEVQLSSILFSVFYASSSSINFGSLYLFIPTPDLPSQFPILVCLSLSFIHSSCSYAICNLGGGGSAVSIYIQLHSCIVFSASVHWHVFSVFTRIFQCYFCLLYPSRACFLSASGPSSQGYAFSFFSAVPSLIRPRPRPSPTCCCCFWSLPHSLFDPRRIPRCSGRRWMWISKSFFVLLFFRKI